ncbi:MAG: AAA family ATPase, partial [Nannocystaceae bacterium]
MKLAENPFAAGKPVAARPAFVGRRAVVQTLVELLQAREHGLITISGPPGIGKTSFLRALRDELPEHGTYQAVYIDLSKRAKWPLAAAVRGVASTIARALGLGKPLLPGPSDLVFRDTWLPATLGNLFSGGMGATLVLLIDNYKRPSDPQHAEHIRAFASYLKQL